MEYRINGFEQIKALYSIVFSQKYDFTPHHISLYVFLINQNNRNEWVEWFKCPYDLAMAGACIGNKKTYYKCLNDLQEWKLLEYQKGVNEWKAPKIKLAVLKCTSSVPQSVPLPEPLHTTLPEPLHTTLPEPLHTTLVGINNNLKPITYNLKPKTEKLDFDIFWNLYNKKVGDRKKCEKKWNGLKLEIQQKIIDTIPKFISQFSDKQFQPHPSTYLNQERWNDEILLQVNQEPKTLTREEKAKIILEQLNASNHEK